MTQVLQFSLGPLSRLLANADVSIYKFVKFKLLESVETGIPIVGCIPFNSTVVHDGTCVIRQLPKVSQPLVSGTCQNRIARCQLREVIFVRDQCFEMSIKERETDNRTSTRQTWITASRQDQTAIKQFKKYISVGTNKTELLQFC